MRRLTIDMQALVDAMTMPADVPWRSFLDLRDGAIVEFEHDEGDLDDDDTVESATDPVDVWSDPERYREIPRLESPEQYEIMAAFAAAVEDDDVSERLGDALHGRGAFSRFRRVVDSDRHLRDQWFAFRHEELIRHARRWLSSLDVEPLYDVAADAKRFAGAESAFASPAPAVPQLGLLDLVLLGAPDGKTELLDGQVLRQIRAQTTSQARSIFTRVARELCWFFDEPWRKRYVEGKTAVDLGRAHLRVDGDAVQLWIDVPRATWNAFS